MTDLAEVMKQLASRSNLPSHVSATAQSLAERLNWEAEICVVCSDKTAIEAFDRLAQLEMGFGLTMQHSAPGNIRSRGYDLVVAVPNVQDIHQVLSDLEQAQSFSERLVIWDRNGLDFAGSAPSVRIIRSSKPEKAIDWIKRSLKNAREADEATAVFLANKWFPNWETLETAETPISDVKDVNEARILSWCLSAIEKASDSFRHSLPRGQQRDIDAAHDQLVLLDLEGTHVAAVTALRIIIQIRDEIAQHGFRFDTLNLPNLKP